MKNSGELYIGVMSGSSLDGLDIICSKFDDASYKVLAFDTLSLSEDITIALRNVKSLSVFEYLKLRSEYSSHVASCLTTFITKNELNNIKMVVIHGHTVLHKPDLLISEQMVDGGLISSLLNLDILVDLRIQDIGSGGEGAPLAPIIETLIGNHNCYINLGGICNISIHSSKIKAYDISPCNQLLNFFARKEGKPYDDQGKIGRKGAIIPYLLSSWESLPFFNKLPPKSLDNSWIEQHFLTDLPDASNADLLQTSYHFIANSILNVLNFEEEEIREIVFTGGGAHNKYLMELLANKLDQINISIVDNVNTMMIDSKEALLMAYMGYLYTNNIYNTLPSATGSKTPQFAGGYYKANLIQ